jgi:ATP-dependent DNA helicase RecG
VLRHGKLLRAGVFLAGKEQAIQEHFPGYVWTHLRMKSDTDYADRMDGRDALPVALNRILDRINADNPITTVTHGPHHFEYRTYPEIALREAAMNAFYHADYRLAGPILVKQYGSKLEISNPGGLVGDITPQNILHHQPLARNPCLVDALTRLRLVNRSNVGIQRMFSTLLMEGKEPPQIVDHGQSVIVTFRAMPSSAPFRAFVAEESKRSRILTVDHLLVLLHLLREPEVDVTRAAQLCQRTENEMREVLVQMEREWGYLGRGGAGRGVYWALRPELHQKLAAPGHPDRDRRIDWEAAKTRVLSVLKQRAKRGEPGLSNADVRRITALGRSQVKRLMDELRAEASVRLGGKGRCAKWTCGGAMD